VASKLRKKYQFTWLADYRDLWSMNHTVAENHPRQIEFERQLLSFADGCLTVSEGLRSDLRRVYQGPCHVLFNGFKNLNRAADIKYDPICNIEYTGQIYRDFQDIITLLGYLQSADSKYLDTIALNFSGSSGLFLQNLYKMDRIPLPNFIRNFGKISNQNAIIRQQNATFLLFLNWISSDDRGVIPTKIYEYISSGTPILVFGKTANIEVTKILLKAGFFLEINTQEDVDQFFLNYRSRTLILPRRNLDFISQFQYAEQVKSLISILENCTVEKKSANL